MRKWFVGPFAPFSRLTGHRATGMCQRGATFFQLNFERTTAIIYTLRAGVARAGDAP